MKVVMKGKWIARVSAKGQVTIPKEVRELLGIKPGDFVAFIARDGEIVLKKARVEVM